MSPIRPVAGALGLVLLAGVATTTRAGYQSVVEELTATRMATQVTAEVTTEQLVTLREQLEVNRTQLATQRRQLQVAADQLRVARDQLRVALEQRDLVEEQRDIARRQLAETEQLLALTQQLLVTARDTEQHAESIDRKTGAAPAGGPPSTPLATIPGW